MAVRTKKYHPNNGAQIVRVVQITADNLTDIVVYICRNGGAATGHNGRPQYGRPARIRIKQHTFGATWAKMDWRVAHIGDYIVRWSDTDFERVKQIDFPNRFVPAN